MTLARREELRRKAEELVSQAPRVSGRDSVTQLLHELSVYEEELEIQNEELREAQQELSRSQRRFAQLFEEAPNAYFVLDDDANVHELNARAVALFGQPRAWIVGKPLIVGIEGESHTAFEAHRREVLAGSAHAQVEIDWRSPGGRRRLLLDSVRIPVDGFGPRVLVSAKDVTSLHEAQAERRRSDARWLSLLEHSRDATLVIDGSGALVDVNPAACELFGRERAELLSGSIATLAAPGFEAQVAALLVEEHSTPHELAVRSRAGALVWVEVSASRIEGLGGWRLIIARDLTERRAASAERDRLEAEVGKGQRLDALGRLAGGIAHDINNVLSAVLTVGSILLEELSDEAQRADLEALMGAAHRGADLTKRLLAFARGEQAVKEPLSIAAVCREVASLVRRTADQKVRIELELDDDATVEGDAGALSQVLLNLCVNSLDAMPEGGQLGLRARQEGASIVIEVDDTGSGMDDATATRAFDPFFTTKPKGRGTGLGLAMVYGTVKKHGGVVALRSEVSRGTTVRITLPRATRPLPRKKPTPVPQVQIAGSCLLVDDDSAVRHASSALLRRLGLSVTTADGGPEAARIFEAGARFGVYVVDLNMPEVDGVELTRVILESEPEARVLLCSGYSPEAVPPSLLTRQNVRYLGKPFAPAALARELEGLFNP